MEAARLKLKDLDLNYVVEFQHNKTSKLLRFPRFSVENKFPDNVYLLKNSSVVVCADILETGKDVFVIAGFKFCQLKDSYKKHFSSSKFHVHIASKISPHPSEWNVNNVAAKMYITPHKFADGIHSVPDIVKSPNSQWYVSPIFHTLQ
jgi:hypothetical protein